VKIFSRKIFALEVVLGQEEVQGIIIIQVINTSVKKYASERGFSSSSSEEEVRFFLSSVLQNFRCAAARVHLTRVASHARTSKNYGLRNKRQIKFEVHNQLRLGKE